MPRVSSSGIDGVSIRHYPDNTQHAAHPWLARVKDEMGRWKGKWFVTEDEASRWAGSQVKAFAKGGTAGRVLMSVLGPAYVKLATKQGVTVGHQRKLSLVWEAMVRNGLDNLSHPDFGKRFQLWISGLMADWWISDDERRSPTTAHTYRHLKEHNRDLPASDATKDFVAGTARCIIEDQAILVSPPLLTYNPLRHIRSFRKNRDRKIRLCFTVEELKLMVSDEMRDHPFWLAACLAVYNPRRTAEALFLRWEWFNWEADSVRLVNTPELQAAKVGLKSGETSWPLEPELKAILQPMAKPYGWVIENDQIRKYASWSRVRKDHTGKQKPTHTRGFGRYFEACGVEQGERVPYCLRHTGITIRLAMGISSDLVGAYAAHEDSGTTLKHYGRERALFSHRVKHWGGRFYLRDPEPQPQPAANLQVTVR